MFLPIAKTQQVVDTVTWLAAYNGPRPAKRTAMQ